MSESMDLVRDVVRSAVQYGLRSAPGPGGFVNAVDAAMDSDAVAALLASLPPPPAAPAALARTGAPGAWSKERVEDQATARQALEERNEARAALVKAESRERDLRARVEALEWLARNLCGKIDDARKDDSDGLDGGWGVVEAADRLRAYVVASTPCPNAPPADELRAALVTPEDLAFVRALAKERVEHESVKNSGEYNSDELVRLKDAATRAARALVARLTAGGK